MPWGASAAGAISSNSWLANYGGLPCRTFLCPKSGGIFDFLTNEPERSGDSRRQRTAPPGLIAQLYQMRWDIEESYLGIKNKLNEREAWAKLPTAKAMQAQFVCMAHSLKFLQEHRLLVEEKVSNTSEIKRKATRLAQATAILTVKKQVMPVLQQDFLRHIQRSVKFIRWLRAFLFLQAPWQDVVAVPGESYRIP